MAAKSEPEFHFFRYQIIREGSKLPLKPLKWESIPRSSSNFHRTRCSGIRARSPSLYASSTRGHSPVRQSLDTEGFLPRMGDPPRHCRPPTNPMSLTDKMTKPPSNNFWSPYAGFSETTLFLIQSTSTTHAGVLRPGPTDPTRTGPPA